MAGFRGEMNMERTEESSLKNEKRRLGILVAKSPGGRVNIGDYIQGLAARQFFEGKPVYVDRERMAEYGGEAVKMIMNGWFMYNPSAWPPSEKIEPLLVSMHFTRKALEKIGRSEGLEFLKRYEPVGCRDRTTQAGLERLGVKCYFSGCLTTTLGESYKRKRVGNKIYVVDAFTNLRPLKAVLRKPMLLRKGAGHVLNARKRILGDILERVGGGEVEYVKHWFKAKQGVSEDQLFEMADGLLRKYSEAKLVISSRIHCALPCIAMGTPVIFIDDSTMGSSHAARFDGLVDFFNTLSIDENFDVRGSFDLEKLRALGDGSFNPQQHVAYAERLKEKCRAFVPGRGRSG